MCQNPDSTGVVFEEALPTTISGKGLQPWVINHHDFHISRYSTLQPTRGLPLASCYFSSFEMARPMFVAGRASNSGLPVCLKSLSFNHERSRPVIQPPQMIKPTPVVGFQTPVIQPLWFVPLIHLVQLSASQVGDGYWTKSGCPNQWNSLKYITERIPVDCKLSISCHFLRS